MEQGEVLVLMQDAISTVLIVAAPVLIIGMVVGIVISIFQATTQINDQTMSFVPKILAIMFALMIFGSWMLTYLSEFTNRVFDLAVNTILP